MICSLFRIPSEHQHHVLYWGILGAVVMRGVMTDRFRYLKMSLVFLLAYVGVKVLLAHHYPIPNLVPLAFIAGIQFVGIAASIIAGAKAPAHLVGLAIDDALDELRA